MTWIPHVARDRYRLLGVLMSQQQSGVCHQATTSLSTMQYTVHIIACVPVPHYSSSSLMTLIDSHHINIQNFKEDLLLVESANLSMKILL